MNVFCRILTVGLALGAGSVGAHGAQIPVTTTADVMAEDGLCALREAVRSAVEDLAVGNCPAGVPGELDQVLLGPGVHALALGGPGNDTGLSGDLDVYGATSVRIAGAGAGVTAIDAAGIDRALHVQAGATLVVEDLAVRGGDPGAEASGIGAPAGAILNAGTLTLRRVVLEGNQAGDGPRTVGDGGTGGLGGALYSFGPVLTIADAVFRANRAGDGGRGVTALGGDGGQGGSGGAIVVQAGTAQISGSTFDSNASGAGGSGGAGVPGLVPAGTGGNGGSAGAVWVTGSGGADIVNSTFTGNRAGAAGDGGTPVPGGVGAVARAGSGEATIRFSTFSGNLRAPGSTLGNGLNSVSVSGSVLGDPAPECSSGGAPAGGPANVTGGDASCTGPRVDGDLVLGALGDNGGPTPTHAPGAGSAAIDAIPAALCIATDQRALPRPALAACDAGALEVQPPPPVVLPASPGGAVAAGPRVRSLRVRPAAFVARRGAARITFRLDAAAQVTLTVRRLVSGRRVGRLCARPRADLRRLRPCTRRVPRYGRIEVAGTTGLNGIGFAGGIGGRALPPGRYELVARIPGGGPPAVRAFRILRP